MRRKLFGSRKRKLATLLVIGSLVAAGAGIAAWLVQSEGLGAGKVATLTPPTVAPATATTTMAPGQSGTLAFNITSVATNPTLKLVGVVQQPQGASPSNLPAGCGGQSFTVVTDMTTNISIPPGVTTFVELPLISLNADAPTECQGATPRVNYIAHFSTP
jgi:hypothetical protein